MAKYSLEIRVKGKKKTVTAMRVYNTALVTRGRLLKVAEIFDEYWLEKRRLPNPLSVIEAIRESREMPDLFTFSQRVPDTDPRFDLPFEWDNLAVTHIDSYDDWFRNKISASARRNIRASEKRGVTVQDSRFNDDYVRGIVSIYNESPIRHGKRFRHYGKDLTEARDANGTYYDRSTFLGAYYQGAMIGYCKIVWDEESAAIMEILSKMQYFALRPNNALLSAAVRQCCLRNIRYLLYERFVYGTKVDSSLTQFKANNGFERMDIPRYYVPFTNKGRIALKLGLHKSMQERIPNWLMTRFVGYRKKYYEARRADG